MQDFARRVRQVVIKIIGRWWRRRQRSIDLEILWPIFVEKAPDIDHAKVAFAFHCFNDTAWTKDFSHDELKNIISGLNPSDRDI